MPLAVARQHANDKPIIPDTWKCTAGITGLGIGVIVAAWQDEPLPPVSGFLTWVVGGVIAASAAADACAASAPDHGLVCYGPKVRDTAGNIIDVGPPCYWDGVKMA
jgi:hypothetical protein